MIFFALNLSDGTFIMLINGKMPTIVGIFTFMSLINFMLSRVGHDKSSMTLGQLIRPQRYDNSTRICHYNVQHKTKTTYKNIHTQ